MCDSLKFHFGGQWVEPVDPRLLEVGNPATERVCGRVAIGSPAGLPPALAAGSQVQMGVGNLPVAIAD